MSPTFSKQYQEKSSMSEKEARDAEDLVN